MGFGAITLRQVMPQIGQYRLFATEPIAMVGLSHDILIVLLKSELIAVFQEMLR
jgi:hypothetical protein